MDVTGNRQVATSSFLTWTRPRSYWFVVGAHLPLALVTGIALLMSRLVPLNLLPLKPCTFLRLTDYPGPFCGFSRSFWAMAEGDWASAMNNSPFACVVYIATAFLFAWNATGLLLGVKIERGPSLRLRPGWARWVVVTFCVLLLLNWAYRLSLGLK